MSPHPMLLRHARARMRARPGLRILAGAASGALVLGLLALGTGPATAASPGPAGTTELPESTTPGVTAPGSAITESTIAESAGPEPDSEPAPSEPVAPPPQSSPPPFEGSEPSDRPETDAPTPPLETPAPSATTGTTAPAPAAPEPRARAPSARLIGILAAGVPGEPVPVWDEGFDAAGNALIPLRSYASGAYTADTFWLDAAKCNGVIVNYNTSTFSTTECTSSVTQNQTNARVNVRRLADVLGQVDAGVTGGTSASAPANGSTATTQSNRAVAEWTDSGTGAPGGTRVIDKVAAAGITATTSRYYTSSIDIVEASCDTASSRSAITLSLIAGATTNTGSAITACTDARASYYTSPLIAGQTGWIFGGASVRAGRFTADTSVLLTPAQAATLRPVVRNTNVASAGNDFAVDNLRILDATPSLDKSFSPATVGAGTASTLTFTVTNTSELAAKPDWSFTDALPAGLVVASTPAIGGTCANATGTAFSVRAAVGASTITATGGDLAVNATSCTITVNVVAAAAGSYTNGPANVTTVLNVPDEATLTVNPPSTLTVRKNLPTRAASTDQFTLSLRSGTAVLASATTTGTATGIQAAQITRYVVQPGSTYTIHETATSGAGLGYANSYECLRGTTVIASGSSASGSLTIPGGVGVDVICTFTNSAQTVRLACDTNHFYSVTPAGALVQADIVTGTTAAVGSWTGTSDVNGLGIASGGSAVYALQRSADTTDVASILKWTAANGFQTLANTTYATVGAGGTQIAGSLVAGAVDLTNGRYLFGKFNAGNFSLWSFTESNPPATRFAYLGSFAAGSSPNGNGDMAFDSRGNLYVLGSALVNNASSVAVFTVTAATLASASGGTLAVSASTTRALTGTDATPAFASVNGIAFSPRGTVYLGNAGSAYEFDPATWTRVSGSPRVTVDSTDLSSCSTPPAITLQKDVVGRAHTNDQFQLAISAGSPLAAIGAATTTGTATGRQAQQVGPLPTQLGSTLTISESMATGSSSALTDYTILYECWADGVRIADGAAASGTVTVPERLGASVTCTFFNSPRPASTVRITKLVQDAAGTQQPAAGWTVGVTATATAGTATALPAEVPRQQTDAGGQATWSVLYGSMASRAALAISEVQRSGFEFLSGDCTVNGRARAVSFTESGGVVSGSIPGIAAAATVECTLINRPLPTLTLVKNVSSGTASPTLWTLSATGPSGALPGPVGVTGTSQTTAVAVTAGAAYRLAESGGSATYVQTGAWQCVNAAGAAVSVTAAGDVSLAPATAVTCTVTNATASLTLVKQVQDAQPGFEAADWSLTATPATFAGGSLPTQTRVGAEYVTGGNAASTFEVRPGHTYTLSERLTHPRSAIAYRQVRLERLSGTTWTPVSTLAVTAPAAGQTVVYRFVNAPVQPTTLPLTGGTSADAYLIAGTAVMTLALALAVAHTWRRIRRRPL